MKFATGLGIATTLLISCTKADIRSSEFNRTEAMSSISAQPKSRDFIILCRNEGVSQRLLDQAAKLGSVRANLSQIGVVLASSTNSNFEAELAKMPEVQKVLPDIHLNWLEGSFNQDKVVALEATDAPAANLETNMGLGLSGSNPLLPLQWSHSSVQTKGAFTKGYKGAGAVVAILDGGFHTQHPDLVSNVLADKSVSFVPGQSVTFANPNGFSHGSHLAGIVAAADNNVGVAGIAPSAKLMLVKVLGDAGSGEFGWLIQGVLYAADNGADIINMSLGASFPRNGKFVDDNGTPSDPSDDFVVNEAKEIQDLITALNRAFQYARKKGSLPIVSAGNNGNYVTGQGQGTNYPANCAGVVTIAANSPNGWAKNPDNAFLYEPSSYTNSGRSLVNLAAPGGDFDYPGEEFATIIGVTIPVWAFDMVLSIGSMSRYNWVAGTSMACPAASGVAALIAGKYQGDITPAQLEAKLKASSVDLGAPGADAFFGNGQVNAANAVEQ